MEKHRLIKKFQQITIWKKGYQRAPHKPLLLLYALSQCWQKKPRLISYKEIDNKLKQLLVDFGPDRKTYHTEYPFWRLKNDDIWEVVNVENVKNRKGNTDAKKSELLKYNVYGGFKEVIYNALINNPDMVSILVTNILEEHFPSSMYEDILQSVGLDWALTKRQKRDSNFRNRILIAYEYQCAVCGLNIRIGDSIIGLDAAHIKWHQAGGPDVEENGLSLCSLHHKLFDRGAFAISNNMKVLVSNLVNGSAGVDDWLLSYHAKYIKKPQYPEYYPDPDYLLWHRNNVFKGEKRYIDLM